MRTAPSHHPSVSYLGDADCLIAAAMGRPRAPHLLARVRDDGLAVSIIAVIAIYDGAFCTPDPQPTRDGFRAFLGAFAILPVTDPQGNRLRVCAPRAAGRVNAFPPWLCPWLRCLRRRPAWTIWP